MTVFVAGNSHAIALVEGAQLLDTGTKSLRFFSFGMGLHENRVFSRRVGNRVKLVNPAYPTRLKTHTGRNYIDAADVWVLVMGTHNARIISGPFWTEATPLTLTIDGLRPVSSALLDQIILDGQHYVRAFIDQLLDIGTRVIVASCPPIRRDGTLGKSAIPKPVIAEIDRAARKHFVDWLSSRGVPFVAPPQSTFDAEGFLLPEYGLIWMSEGVLDPHHANGDYGKLMMVDVLAAVKTHFPDAL